MKNFEGKNNKNRQNNEKNENKENEMKNSNIFNNETKSTRKRKTGLEFDMDLVEFFVYCYRERFNTKDLIHEMSISRRTVQRMADHINELYPCIVSTVSDQDGQAYYSVLRNFSEHSLDSCFQKSHKRPLLYIFLFTFLVRPLSVKEIMHKLNTTNQDKAIDILNGILDATWLVDTEEYNGQTYLGAWDFLENLSA